MSGATPSHDTRPRAAHSVHLEQLCRILDEQQETCQQLAACAQEQQAALLGGKGPDFVRASLTQAHLARRLYFLEEERTAAIQALAQALVHSEGEGMELAVLMERLPEADARRLAARTQELHRRAEEAAAVQRVNAQMIQTNLQLAAALTRQRVDPATHYLTQVPGQEGPAIGQLDRHI